MTPGTELPAWFSYHLVIFSPCHDFSLAISGVELYKGRRRISYRFPSLAQISRFPLIEEQPRVSISQIPDGRLVLCHPDDPDVVDRADAGLLAHLLDR